MNGQPPNNGQPAPASPYGAALHPQPDYAAQTAAAALSSSATAPPLQQQQHVPAASATAAPTGRKRKAGQPGSRGVANLTPEQLAKKRANDREAQRAIRERTKNTIESLERRIRELESQQPYQELQRAVADRDHALQECEELRKRLSAVAGIVGNRDLGQTGLNELAALTAQQSPLPPLNGQHYPQQPPDGQYEPPAQQNLHPELRSPHSSHTTESPAQNSNLYQGPEESIRRWTDSAEHHPQPAYPPQALPYDQQHAQPPAPVLQQAQASGTGNSNGERHGLSFVLEQHQRSPLASAKPTHDPHQDYALQLIRHQQPTCPLDHLLGDLINGQRHQLSLGNPISQVLGNDDQPTFIGLLSPDIPRRSPIDPISTVLVDILSKFPDIKDLPERTAVLYVMYHIARWLICPCEPCWKLIPEWSRPLPLAMEYEHATWTDFLPWPIMRKHLTLARKDIKFDDFFVPFTLTLSLNWPYPASQCLLIKPDASPGDDASSQAVMNPVFEEHIMRLENWSLGKEFVDLFPDLLDESVRIIEHPKSKIKQAGRGLVGH